MNPCMDPFSSLNSGHSGQSFRHGNSPLHLYSGILALHPSPQFKPSILSLYPSPPSQPSILALQPSPQFKPSILALHPSPLSQPSILALPPTPSSQPSILAPHPSPPSQPFILALHLPSILDRIYLVWVSGSDSLKVPNADISEGLL